MEQAAVPSVPRGTFEHALCVANPCHVCGTIRGVKRTCPHCGAVVLPRSRFCPNCGRALPPAQPAPPAPPTALAGAATHSAPGEPEPPEGALSGARRIRIQGDLLSLHELINMVESGVRWWQSQLEHGDVTREQAARSIQDLSQILSSLSQQLALGRETVRITAHLPALRQYSLGCPFCGYGNRAGAKFCQRCGTPFGTPASGIPNPPPAQPIKEPAPMRLRFVISARTDKGRVRKNNQDSIYTGEMKLPGGQQAYLCLVADGMGGALAGEQASQIAAEVLRTQIQAALATGAPLDDANWEALMREGSRAANQRVYQESRTDAARRGMGTTLTVALIAADRVHIASVGDSRAYLLNASGVTEDGATAAQLTSDHSLVARLVDIGQITSEEARTHPQRNLLYRSIGTDPSVEVDTRSEQLEPGDLILLCSDGLINYLRDEELAQIALHEPPERACEHLVRLANERGGGDNISVVIVRVERG